MADLTRRQFLAITGGSLAGSSLALLGFSPRRGACRGARVQARPHHRDPQHLSLLLGRLRRDHVQPGRQARRTPAPSIIHIEGDRRSPGQPRHAVPEGRRRCSTSCTAPAGCKYPRVPRARQRASGQRISWDEALDRIAELMKDDRDANFIAKNADGQTVNRWLTTGMLAASAISPTKPATSPTRSFAVSACWRSITRRVSDTARRWQVLPRRSAVAR